MYELAGLADVIVVGRIVAVEPKTFELAVEDVVVGEGVPTTIRVRKFKDWTCHHRWTAYAQGQRLLFFLDEEDDLFAILGAGDEGEMPILGDHAITEATQGYRVRGIEVGTYEVGGGQVTGSMLPLAELCTAIAGCRDVFLLQQEERRWRVEAREGQGSVEAFSRSSAMARHICEEVTSAAEWSGLVEAPDVSLRASELWRISGRERGFSGRSRLAPGREPDEFGFELMTGFGHALAYLGDVDGDGLGDLAVGAPSDSYLGHFHGAVWILFLDERGGVRARTEIREELSGFPATMNEFSGLGTAIAPLGDLDGDGIPDLLVSAPLWDGSAQHQGGVWVSFLRRDGTIQRTVELGVLAALREAGVSQGCGLGESLAVLGDIGGDGTLEVAIGQDPEFELGQKSGRSVWIVSLTSQADVTRVQRIQDREDGFVQEHSWFGKAIASLGDVDQDGHADMAIADPYDQDGGELRGAIWIVFLTPESRIKGKTKISDWSGGFEGVLEDSAQLGFSLVSPGDLDGDGTPELLAASWNGIWCLFLGKDGAVRSHVQSVLLGEADEETAPAFGWGLAVRGAASADPRMVLAVGGGVGPSMERDAVVCWLSLAKDGRLARW